MRDFVPPEIFRAAEARAMGASWEAAAMRAGWEMAGLRAWIRRHLPLWYRALARARRDQQTAACDEAVAVLRKHLRNDEAKSCLRAAESLTATFSPMKPARRKPVPIDDNEQFMRMLEAVPEGVTTRLELHLATGEEEVRKTALAAAAAGARD